MDDDDSRDEKEARRWRGEVLEINEVAVEGNAQIEVTLSAAIPKNVLRVLKLEDPARHKFSAPPICVLDHPFCSGVWFPTEFDPETLKIVCSSASAWDAIPGMGGGNGEPRTQSWTIDVDDDGQHNVCFVLKTPDRASRPCCVCIAPTMRLYSRATFMSVNEIDTVTQSFKTDAFFEFRARRIAKKDVPAEIVEYAFGCYGMHGGMFSFLNVLEMESEPWSSTGTNIMPGFLDFCFKRRIQARFADKMDLQKFPFDQQKLMVTATLNHPNSLVTLVENLEYPSKFLFKNFQLDSIWDVPGQECVEFLSQDSDPVESSARYQYSRASFQLRLNRKSGYYVSNVAIPMAVLTYLSVLSASVEPDGSSMGTADRLSVTLTLVLTAVAYKFVVASSIPQVSYLTELDKYVLVCFLFMVIAAVENVLYPALLIDRSDPDELKERVQERLLIIAFLAVFSCVNLYSFYRVLFLLRQNRPTNSVVPHSL